MEWNPVLCCTEHNMIYCPCEGYVNVCSICYFLVLGKISTLLFLFTKITVYKIILEFFFQIKTIKFFDSQNPYKQIIIFCCLFHLKSSVMATSLPDSEMKHISFISSFQVKTKISFRTQSVWLH